MEIRPQLDWSAYASYGEGDAYAQLPLHGGDFGKAAAVCIGSRQCQRNTDKSVMCPSFRISQDVAHSTQFRAAVLKAALNGELGELAFAGPELEAAMDLCVACKGCKRECPNGVDMAILRCETLAQRWLYQPVPRRERLVASLPKVLAQARASVAGGLIRLLAHALLNWRERSQRVANWVERRFGIAATRRLPRWARFSFLEEYSVPSRADTDAREVVLLVDTFSNHADPDNAWACFDLLTAAGYQVHVATPSDSTAPLCCGRTAWSTGLVEETRAHAQRMLQALQPFVERGLPVIGLEPSCLLMLRDEYQSLGLGEPAAKLGKAALLLEEFLAREHDAKRLDLRIAAEQPVRRILVHGHCHQKAFGAMKSMRKVLGLVPNLEIEFIEASCCGMAGSFGLEAEHYNASMQMAELALLPAVRKASADTEIIANGFSCRHQIHDGSERAARHFVHVLRAAQQTDAAR